MSAPDVRATVRAALKTVQGTKHHLGLVTLDVLTDNVTEAVEQLVDAYRAEVLAEHAALLRAHADLEHMATHHTVAAGLRRAALLLEQGNTSSQNGDALHAADRQTALLAAIREERARRWKSGRAAQLLRRLGYGPVSSSTASHDLAALAAAGHLIRHDQLGVRWYELRKDHTT